MNIVSTLRLIGLSSLIAASLAHGQEFFKENFNAYAAGSNLIGQGGWTGWTNGATNAIYLGASSNFSSVAVDTRIHPGADGTISAGSGVIARKPMNAGLSLTRLNIMTFDAYAYSDTGNGPTSNNDLFLGRTTDPMVSSYQVGWSTYGPTKTWFFGAYIITGLPGDGVYIEGGYDKIVHLGIVVDPLAGAHGQFWGTYDFGAGGSGQTPHYDFPAGYDISQLNAVILFGDYLYNANPPRGGGEFDNISVRTMAVGWKQKNTVTASVTNTNYDLTLNGTTVYVAYENAGNIYVTSKAFGSSNWTAPQLVAVGTQPSITTRSGVPYMAYVVGNHVNVASNNGSSWSSTDLGAVAGTFRVMLRTDGAGTMFLMAESGGYGSFDLASNDGSGWSAFTNLFTGYYDSGSGNYAHQMVLAADPGGAGYKWACEADNWGAGPVGQQNGSRPVALPLIPVRLTMVGTVDLPSEPGGLPLPRTTPQYLAMLPTEAPTSMYSMAPHGPGRPQWETPQAFRSVRSMAPSLS